MAALKRVLVCQALPLFNRRRCELRAASLCDGGLVCRAFLLRQVTQRFKALILHLVVIWVARHRHHDRVDASGCGDRGLVSRAAERYRSPTALPHHGAL
jgi:hypothetical protein